MSWCRPLRESWGTPDSLLAAMERVCSWSKKKVLFKFFLFEVLEAPKARYQSGHEDPSMTHSRILTSALSNSNTLGIISTVSHQDEKD